MVQSRSSILINRPADEVYRFIVDGFEHNYRRWSPEVQRLDMLTHGPLRVGTRARQVRVDQGRRTDSTFQVVALEPRRRVRFAETSRRFEGEYAIAEAPEGTRLSFDFRLQKIELYMRPFEKLIRVAVRDGTERTVRNIKRLVELDASRNAGPDAKSPEAS